MINNQPNSEKGQAIVLLVFAMVVLLGFTALAVDGSMVYSDRRFAQNVSDAASLAGGGAAALYMENANITYQAWPCSATRTTSIPGNLATAASLARTASVNRAGDNDVTIDQDISDQHGVITECGTDNTNPFFPDKFLDITTNVTVDTQTAFAHFVYRGIMRNSVESITRVRPRSPAIFGHAIVALNPDQCSGNQNGASFHGSTHILVHGGGIFSNGCMDQDGNGPNFDVTVDGGGIAYQYAPNNTDFSVFTPAPQVHNTQVPVSMYNIEPPDCGHANAHNVTANAFETDASDAGGLAPGLYCVTGTIGFHGNDTFHGDGVTIVLLNGGMTVTGNPTMIFNAPVIADPAPARRGLLIYAPPSNHSVITLSGTSASRWMGTVLAPGADVELLGTGDNQSFRTQIIAYNVDVGGTSDTEIWYDGSQQAWVTTSMDLWR